MRYLNKTEFSLHLHCIFNTKEVLIQTSAWKQKFGHQVCLYFAKVNNPACMDFLQTGEVNGDAKV